MITIGIPRATDTAIVCIRLGQSNSFGYAANSSIDAGYKQTYTNIKTWTGAAFASLDYAVNNNQYPAPLTDCSGSEYALLVGLQAKFGGTIYDIKYGVPDTYLGNSTRPTANWLPTTNNSYYNDSRAVVAAALANLWASGKKNFKIFFFWDQGEGDAKYSVDASAYQTNLTAFITAWRNYLGGSCDTYFICPRLSTTLFQTDVKNTITNATNATPIVITCGAAHNITTGDRVEVAGVTGNTAANGSNWAVTVVSPTTFSLDTSVGNGAFTGCTQGWNPFVFRATVITAVTNVASAMSKVYSYSTDSFTKDSGGVHYTAQGYKDKGEYAINNIINSL